MTRSTFLRTVAVAALAVSTSAQAEISFKASQVAPGFHVLIGEGGFAGGNLGLLTGKDGAILIDDSLAPLAATTVAAIESITSQQIAFVINTHLHDDHTGANDRLHAGGAWIVGHDNVRERMVADGKVDALLPQVTFSNAISLHLNGYRAEVFHLPAAHTDGDAVIYFPSVNVIHTGDILFNRMYPFIDLDAGGTVTGYLAAQQRILKMIDDKTTIIPGHGAVGNKADLQAANDMLVDARARIKALVDSGKDLQQTVAAKPLAGYENWSWDFISTESMIKTLYRDLTQDR